MKIFIAGATGVLGRRLTERLAARGHQVVGLNRSEKNSALLRQLGAEPRECDLFDPEQVREVSADCAVVLHLATAIPTRIKTTRQDWAANDRIRREGTRNLVDAALATRAALYVQQSITFLYGDRAGAWVDETTAIAERQADILQSATDMERIVGDAIAQKGLPAVVLRFGSFYAEDAAHTRAMLEGVRARRLPIVGDGKAFMNLIHVDDAAQAVVATVEHAANNLGETFNVCDGAPVTQRELFEHLADTMGVPRPRRVPVLLAKLLLGPSRVATLLASHRSTSGKARVRLHWRPSYPSYREGFRAVIERWRSTC